MRNDNECRCERGISLPDGRRRARSCSQGAGGALNAFVEERLRLLGVDPVPVSHGEYRRLSGGANIKKGDHICMLRAAANGELEPFAPACG